MQKIESLIVRMTFKLPKNCLLKFIYASVLVIFLGDFRCL